MARVHNTYTVLIIEDEADIQNFIVRLLELEGYHVLKAADGNTGLAMLKGNAIDLLLLDLRIPEPDGWSVLQTMKHTRKLSRIPVAVVTATAEEAQRQRALRLGAARYLTKPLSAHDLSRTITQILHKKVSHYPTAKQYAASHA